MSSSFVERQADLSVYTPQSRKNNSKCYILQKKQYFCAKESYFSPTNCLAITKYFLNRQRSLACFTLSLAFFNTLSTLLVPLVLSKFYELAWQSGGGRAQLLTYLPFSPHNIAQLSLFFVALIFLKAAFTWGEKYTAALLGERFVQHLRQQLFSAHLQYSLHTHHQKPLGSYLLRYGGDLSAAKQYLTKGIVLFFKDTLLIVLSLTLLLSLLPTLGGIVIIVLLLFGAMVMWLNRQLQDTVVQKRNQKAILLAFVTARLHHFLTIKVFNREPIELDKFEQRNTKLYAINKHYYRRYALIESLISFLSYCLLGIVMYYAYLHRSEQGSVFLVYIMVLVQLMPIWRRMMQVNRVWQTGRISLRKIQERLSAEPQRLTSAIFEYQQGAIRCENVSFFYPNTHKGIQNCSFSLTQHGIYHLKGNKGSGRSTLFRLLLRLYEPTEGSILIDEQNIANIAPNVLRKHITYVAPEALLLGNTVFEAISYSRKTEKRAKAQKLLDKLQISLELDQAIGDSGKHLAGSEQQLLMIVRAWLTRKPIILLDEIFVGLSNEQTAVVVSLLKKARNDKTILIAAQNLPLNLPINGTIEW